MIPSNIESCQLIRLSNKNNSKELVIENIPRLVLDCRSCTINNLKEIHDTTIIGGGDKTRLFMYCHKLPKFDNFVAKKFHKIIIYSPSLNKDISVTSIFNKHMKKDHIVKYYDCKLDKYCEANVKNWEKVVSLTNNNKRYILESPIFEFEHNCDLLKELGLDKVDTNYIGISDNNVCCIFHKKESCEELL